MSLRAAWVITLVTLSVFVTSERVFAEKLMASEDIYTAQDLLERQGFDPGLHTGTITPDTRRALRRYQARHHLTKTGELDRETQDKLGIFVRMVENDPVLGITQQARDDANREAQAWATTHPPHKGQPSVIRAKPTK